MSSNGEVPRSKNALMSWFPGEGQALGSDSRGGRADFSVKPWVCKFFLWYDPEKYRTMMMYKKKHARSWKMTKYCRCQKRSIDTKTSLPLAFRRWRSQVARRSSRALVRFLACCDSFCTQMWLRTRPCRFYSLAWTRRPQIDTTIVQLRKTTRNMCKIVILHWSCWLSSCIVIFHGPLVLVTCYAGCHWPHDGASFQQGRPEVARWQNGWCSHPKSQKKHEETEAILSMDPKKNVSACVFQKIERLIRLLLRQ